MQEGNQRSFVLYFLLVVFNMKVNLFNCLQCSPNFFFANEDFRFEHSEWPKYKSKTVFGKVPMLEIKDKLIHNAKILAQSNAICRYLANEFYLNGNNNFEKAEIDMYQLKDVFFALVKIYGETNAEDQRLQFNSFYNETVRIFMQNLEIILIHKNSEFLIGDYLTWLDLAIIGSWDWI